MTQHRFCEHHEKDMPKEDKETCLNDSPCLCCDCDPLPECTKQPEPTPHVHAFIPCEWEYGYWKGGDFMWGVFSGASPAAKRVTKLLCPSCMEVRELKV